MLLKQVRLNNQFRKVTCTALLCFVLLCSNLSSQNSISTANALLKEGEVAKSLKIAGALIDSLRNSTPPLTHSDSLLLIQLYKLEGSAYLQLGSYTQALIQYQKGLDLVTDFESLITKAKLYNDLATLYYEMKELYTAEKYVKTAIAINKKEKYYEDLLKNYNNLGIIYFELKKYDDALHYLEESLKIISPQKKLEQSLVLTNISQIYFDQKKYAKAYATLQDALQLQNGIPYDIDMIQTQLNMAMVLVKLGKKNEALQLKKDVESQLKETEIPIVQLNSFQYLADICFQLRDSIGGLRFLLMHNSLQDSLKQQTENWQTNQLMQVYEMERLQQQNAELSQSLNLLTVKSERRKLLFAGGIFIAVISAFSLLVLLRQREKLRKYEQQEFKRQEKDLTEKIDLRNRQLTSYTIEQASENILHQKIIDDINQLQKNFASNSEEGEVLKHIHSEIESFGNKKLGEDFRTYFDQVHPDLLLNLSHAYPHLSKNDLHICAYIYLGLSTKEIAALTFREVRSVESSRNRLRKKLSIPAEVSIQTFLLDLSKKN